MMTPPHLTPGSPTAIDAVFEKILLDIVSGAYPEGTRLPAERELSRILGASRPTLREALRRLSMWNLVEARRGSGVVVRPYREWSVEVLPAYLRHGRPQPGQPPIPKIMADVLMVRRTVIVELLRQSTSRLAAGSTAAARRAAALAWEHREDPVTHAKHDFDVVRSLVEAAAFTPGLWVLNRIATIWIDFVDVVAAVMKTPADYLDVYERCLSMIEGGAATEACSALADFLTKRDEALTRAAEAPTPSSAT